MQPENLRLAGIGVVFAVGVALLNLSCLARTEPTAGPVLDAVARDGFERITAERLRAHIAVLADDAMAGRETGTPGFDLAATYVVDQFRELGLSPVGNNYRQLMTIRRARPVEGETTLDVTIQGRRERFVYGQDFVTYGVPGTTSAAVNGRIVFVGDGVTVPGDAIDAYQGLEVSGAIGIALAGAPASLTASERSYYESSRQKAANGAARGLGALLLRDDANIPWELRVRAARRLGISEALPTDRPPTVPVIYLSEPAAKRIFGDLEGSTLEAGTVLGEAELHVRQTSRQVRSANVVARWPAADQISPPEHVVVMAHLDHVGIGAPVGGDAIYNGAVDNASGVAALITIADAFVSLPTRPARSIVFLATTGEEQGLVGSDYFVRHPPMPIDSIVAALNVDGTSIRPFEELDIRGGSNSSLGLVAEAAGKRLRFGVRHQPLGLGGSDHSPFLLAGVPPLWIGAALPDGWMRTHYHTPQDDLSQPLDLGAAARYTQFVFLTSYLTADASDRPTWNSGEFFGAPRVR